MLGDCPQDWNEYLPLALWAYQTTKHGATRATPFLLVYSAKALSLVKAMIPFMEDTIRQ